MIAAVEPAPARVLSPTARWLAPSLSDVIFVALLLWLVLFTINSDGSIGLLMDSGAGYHIRTGDYVLEHKAVPHADVFSFSKAGQPWFAYEWLCGILFSLLYRADGMKALVIFAGAIIALTNVILLRHMIWRGANALVAILVLHLAIGASSLHYLARPHLFTLLFLAAGLWLLDADRRRPSGRIWWLVPLSAVWANIHGGFLGLPISLGIVAVGSVLEGSWTMARRYALVAAACLAASGLNPYGFAFHLHAIRFVSGKWVVDLVQEYQSSRFGSPESMYLEILLFTGVALAIRQIGRKQFASALLILAWAHMALTSMRHVPIYCLVAAPVLAREATLLWDWWVSMASRGSWRAIFAAIAVEHTAGLRRSTLWTPAIVVFLVLFTSGWNWPTDFPEGRFPAAIVRNHADLIAGSQIFTTDSWADYLTFHNYPRQRIFDDGRSDFFGKEISEQYVQILKGHYGWETLMQHYGFDAVLVPSQSALASLLRLRPDWRVIDADSLATLFQHQQ